MGSYPRHVALSFVLLASCAGTLPTVGAIDASERARSEAELTQGAWTTGVHGDAVTSTVALRFIAPAALEETRTTASFGRATSPGTVVHGSYELTRSGAIEWTLGPTTRHETFVVATSPSGPAAWASMGFVSRAADPRTFWHELESHGGPSDPGVELATVLVFAAAPERLQTPSCTARVRIEARTLTGTHIDDAVALDATLHCRVDVRGTQRLLSFTDASDRGALGDAVAWTEAHVGRAVSPRMHDLLGGAMSEVLVWDPSAPRVLREPDVHERVLEP